MAAPRSSSMPWHGAPVAELDLTRVIRAWQNIRDQLVPTMNAVDEQFARDASTLTARRFDEAQPGGAPWTLLRSVFESSAWANWLLDPDTGVDRRRRGARRTVLDQKKWKNFAMSSFSGRPTNTRR